MLVALYALLLNQATNCTIVCFRAIRRLVHSLRLFRREVVLGRKRRLLCRREILLSLSKKFSFPMVRFCSVRVPFRFLDGRGSAVGQNSSNYWNKFQSKTSAQGVPYHDYV